MDLHTPRLILRPIAVHDADALFVARSDPQVMRYWDWPAQKSVEQIEEIFRLHVPGIDDGTILWWAVVLAPDGPAIGECDLSEIDPCHRRAELGFLVRARLLGAGLCRRSNSGGYRLRLRRARLGTSDGTHT